MTHPDREGAQAQSGTRRTTRRPLRPVLLITLFSAIAFAALMYAVIRTELSTSAAELAAVVALGAFGVTVFGLLRTVLILIESAGERRREERAATERRMRDRARKPG